MANALPPVKGAAFATEIALVSTTDTDIFQVAPTLAAGDVVVVKDGVLDGNIDTLPTAVTSVTKLLTVALSTSEMNADRVTVLFSDASGGEWQDAMLTIFTAGQTFNAMKADTAAILLDTGTDGVVLANDAITAAKFDESTAFPSSGDPFPSIATAAAYAIVNSGLGFRGAVSTGGANNKFTIPTLVGLGAGIFADAKAPYEAFVLRDAGGLSAAPQGETQTVTAYNSTTGEFTTDPFTAAVKANDDMIIMHPRIAELAAIKAKTDLITATAVTVASPVASGGDVTTYRGDSYKAGDGRQIEWTVSSSATLTGGTVRVLLDGVATFTGSVQSAVLVRCADITGTQSNAIAEGPHGLQVRVIQADGDTVSVVAAKWTSLDPIGE